MPDYDTLVEPAATSTVINHKSREISKLIDEASKIENDLPSTFKSTFNKLFDEIYALDIDIRQNKTPSAEIEKKIQKIRKDLNRLKTHINDEFTHTQKYIFDTSAGLLSEMEEKAKKDPHFPQKFQEQRDLLHKEMIRVETSNISAVENFAQRCSKLSNDITDCYSMRNDLETELEQQFYKKEVILSKAELSYIHARLDQFKQSATLYQNAFKDTWGEEFEKKCSNLQKDIKMQQIQSIFKNIVKHLIRLISNPQNPKKIPIENKQSMSFYNSIPYNKTMSQSDNDLVTRL